MSTVEKEGSAGIPSFDIDLHTDEVLLDPLPVYAELRDGGPVVWLETYGYYAFPRYAEVIRALKDWDTFTSNEGAGFNEFFNSIKETSLMTHGDQHDEIRQVEGQPLKPKRMRELEPRLREFAEGMVAELSGRSTVEGIGDIAVKMPLEIVTDLVGFDDAGREQLYTWGVEGFNSIGPLHAPRTQPALETMQGYVEYAEQNIPSKIRAGGWADELFRNGRERGWSEELCRGVMNDYVYPSLDTTIHATSAGLLLFAQNPEQWERLRADRSLLNAAVHEIVRLATPIQYFTRVVTKDVEVSGTALPEGSRVLVMFASANRDERQFPNPDDFDITRDPGDHVGWGGGKHSCLGKPLARLEMVTLFDVLADRIERFEVGDYAYEPNNLIRGIGRMDLTLHWAQ